MLSVIGEPRAEFSKYLNYENLLLLTKYFDAMFIKHIFLVNTFILILYLKISHVLLSEILLIMCFKNLPVYSGYEFKLHFKY